MTIHFTGERVVPGDMCTRPDLMRSHAKRYVWAMLVCADLRIVDLGCGTGYGTEILSWTALSAVGIDNDPDAIEFAQANFYDARFIQADLETMSDLQPADLYVAFELLEHLERPKRLIELVGGKPLLWSLPINSPGEFHKQTFTLREAEAFVPGSEIWYQYALGPILRSDIDIGHQDAVKHVLGFRE